MKRPLFGGAIDERFLEHRRRSTSLAGVIGGAVATLLFAYRFYVDHVWSWDLLVVVGTIIGVKWCLLLWYRLRD